MRSTRAACVDADEPIWIDPPPVEVERDFDVGEHVAGGCPDGRQERLAVLRHDAEDGKERGGSSPSCSSALPIRT